MKEKENFNLEEVSGIVNVPPHVIRYWETEFPQSKSERDKSWKYTYNRKDLEVITRIRYLLYEKSYSIADTKNALDKEFG